MTTETTMTKVFKVLASRFSDFQSKIEKLNKKATKVGASLVSFTASEMIQKATVKAHGDYKGKAQTILSRAVAA